MFIFGIWIRPFKHACKLLQYDLVRGLPPYKYEKDNLCCACVKGKQVCASFKSLKSASTSKCLELLHVDLCGPIYIRCLGGSLYVFVRSDDYFRLTWVVFLKDKTKSHKEFKLCRKLQISNNLLVLAIRTDHGREFDQNKFINSVTRITYLPISQHLGLHNKMELLKEKIGQWNIWTEPLFNAPYLISII